MHASVNVEDNMQKDRSVWKNSSEQRKSFKKNVLHEKHVPKEKPWIQLAGRVVGIFLLYFLSLSAYKHACIIRVCNKNEYENKKIDFNKLFLLYILVQTNIEQGDHIIKWGLFLSDLTTSRMISRPSKRRYIRYLYTYPINQRKTKQKSQEGERYILS